MRKTRLVILPTKCLHQMGFLLLFLSCPVIGDWGRIRPESENSHNAIQIDREGTCGLERDPPGGLLSFLNENGSKQCRLGEDSDLITPTKTPFEVTRRSLERRIDARRVSQERRIRVSEKRSVEERDVRKTRMAEERNARKMRVAEERDVRKTRMAEERDVRKTRMAEERDVRKVRMAEERREVRRESERQVRRDVRSRSVESRRSAISRNEVRSRSLSLNRLDNERAVRNFRPSTERNSRRERLHLSRRVNERQNDRRVGQQRHFNRELQNERRENQMQTRNVPERRERETARFARTIENERRDVLRESNRRLTPEQSTRRREDAITRQQSREREQTIRERNDRLSLARRERNDAKKMERTENRRRSDMVNLERRFPEIRSRSVEFLGGKSERRENSDSRREIDSRRFVTASPKFERAPERRIDRENDQVGVKSRRVAATVRVDAKPELYLGNKEESSFEGISKWTDLSSYESFTAGDWTTNCVIGAVVYFLTTRQVKAV